MSTKRNITSYYNLFFLFLSIIWAPVQRHYLHIDGAGRILFFLSVLAILINFSTFVNCKEQFRSASFVCWTLLVLFSFVNSMVKGFVSDYGLLYYVQTNFFISYVFLATAIVELDYNKCRCLKAILIAQLLYLIIGATHLSIEFFDRASAENLGNMLPLTASGCAFVAGLLFCSRQLKGGWLTYGAIIAFVLAIIILTATRKALGAVILAVAGTLLGRSEKINYKTLLLFAVFAFVLYLGLDYVMENTMMGERLASGSENVDVPLSSNPVVNGFFMSVLGDRAIQYYTAIEIFHQNPITGIGIENFNSIANTGIRLHTEYMVQLCENGIIGFFLLVIFYFLLFRGLIRKRKLRMNINIYLFGLLMVLFLNLTTWTYNMQMVMIVYATLITFINSSNETFYRKTE